MNEAVLVTRSAPAAPPVDAAPDAALEWGVNPWREHPAAATAGVLAVLLLWALAVTRAGGAWTGTALGLAALASLSPAFAPSRCRVDADGVARRSVWGWERRAWADLRRARVGEAGVFVSPLPHRTFRDRFRGLFLPVPASHPEHERLLATLRERVASHGL